MWMHVKEAWPLYDTKYVSITLLWGQTNTPYLVMHLETKVRPIKLAGLMRFQRACVGKLKDMEAHLLHIQDLDASNKT